jgi:Protein of unknown function (DUF3592)
MSDLSSPFCANQTRHGSLAGGIPLKRRSPQENLFRSFIGVLVGLGIGGAIAYNFVENTLPGFASSNWSETKGVIKSLNVEQWWGSRSGKSIQIKVVYTYTVDGKQFWSKRIRFPESTDGCDAAFQNKELTDRYREGSTQTVYYDPSNPARSCLVKGPRYFYVFLFGGLSALFLLIGTVGLLSIPSALKGVAAG